MMLYLHIRPKKHRSALFHHHLVMLFDQEVVFSVRFVGQERVLFTQKKTSSHYPTMFGRVSQKLLSIQVDFERSTPKRCQRRAGAKVPKVLGKHVYTETCSVSAHHMKKAHTCSYGSKNIITRELTISHVLGTHIGWTKPQSIHSWPIYLVLKRLICEHIWNRGAVFVQRSLWIKLITISI